MRRIPGWVVLAVGLMLGFALGMALSAQAVHEARTDQINALKGNCPAGGHA